MNAMGFIPKIAAIFTEAVLKQFNKLNTQMIDNINTKIAQNLVHMFANPGNFIHF